jgi:flagellar P-ring protein precursor FlgI
MKLCPMRKLSITLLIFSLVVLMSLSAHAVRIKDVARIDGVRTNQLMGYGLVVGLARTGDTQRSTFTLQSLTAMLSRVGVRIDPKALILRNVAAVMVTASLPPLAEPGTPVDVLVSSIGDAMSLVGGTLLMTPLAGIDGETYVMAQGPLQVGGFGARGASGSRTTKNHLNVGRIPSGGIVERAVPIQLSSEGIMKLNLNHPDFSTARALAEAINQAAAQLGGTPQMALAVTSGTINVTVPAASVGQIASFIGQLEQLDVQPNSVAQVVINGRTGTVVMGSDVRISTVAVAHGALTVSVEEAPGVSQPSAMATGNTQVIAQSTVNVVETPGSLGIIKQGATLADAVNALNALGATPRDLIEILQAIKAAGALHAELKVL